MPFEVLYGAKSDVSHFRAFSTPCAIVEPTERLRKLDDRATMCFFVGYKYKEGGYQVWVPKRRVVVEFRDFVFFEDGLPPPTLNGSRPQPADEDEPTAQPAPDCTTEPPTLPARQMHPRRPYCERPHWTRCTTMDRQRHLICASQYIY